MTCLQSETCPKLSGTSSTSCVACWAASARRPRRTSCAACGASTGPTWRGSPSPSSSPRQACSSPAPPSSHPRRPCAWEDIQQTLILDLGQFKLNIGYETVLTPVRDLGWVDFDLECSTRSTMFKQLQKYKSVFNFIL